MQRVEDRWIRAARLRLARILERAGTIEDVWLEEIAGFRGYRLTARGRLAGADVDLWTEGDRGDLIAGLEAQAARVAAELSGAAPVLIAERGATLTRWRAPRSQASRRRED
jgi:hypothetical protein